MMKIIDRIAVIFFTTMAILALVFWLANPGIVTSMNLTAWMFFAYWAWAEIIRQDS